jgi:hypothetical protein
MSTLNVVVNCLPSNPYTSAGLTVNAWLATDFVRNPSGQQAPPSGSPASTTTTGVGGTGVLTGLSSGTPYWLQVIDQLGYYHWFLANWEANPITLNVNMPVPKFYVPGGGDFTSLGYVTKTSPGGNFDFSSLPAYRNFKLVGKLRSFDNSALSTVGITLDNPFGGGGAYNTMFTFNNGSTVTANQINFAGGSFLLIMPGATATADVFMTFELDFINAQGAGFPNIMGKQVYLDIPNSVYWVAEISGYFAQNFTSITEITFNGNFDTGSYVELFGYGHP